jgi:CRISPR-associated protein Cas5t
VLRTVWRIKDKKLPPGVGSSRRPDFQEILTGLDLLIYVEAGPLAERLQTAAQSPADVVPYGGLSLGESRDLINDLI